MKYLKYIMGILLIATLFLSIISIKECIFLNKELTKQKVLYEDVLNINKAVQKESSDKIATYMKSINVLEIKLKKLKEVNPITITKWRTKYKDKIKVVKEIEYVTLPTLDLSYIIEERDLCCELKEQWEMNFKEMSKKYLSELNTHNQAKKYIKILEKKKRVPTWVYIVLGGFAIKTIADIAK